jgi:hypothetical protein
MLLLGNYKAVISSFQKYKGYFLFNKKDLKTVVSRIVICIVSIFTYMVMHKIQPKVAEVHLNN